MLRYLVDCNQPFSMGLKCFTSCWWSASVETQSNRTSVGAHTHTHTRKIQFAPSHSYGTQISLNNPIISTKCGPGSSNSTRPDYKWFPSGSTAVTESKNTRWMKKCCSAWSSPQLHRYLDKHTKRGWPLVLLANSLNSRGQFCPKCAFKCRGSSRSAMTFLMRGFGQCRQSVFSINLNEYC